jgi:anti-sigma-K factor RskA
MTDSEHISQEDLALYAMQTLSEAESVAVKVHLESCASCRDELGQLLGDLALVGLSVEQHALPEGARQRFLGRISATPIATKQAAPVWISSGSKELSKRGPDLWIPWGAVAALFIAVVLLGVKIHSLNQKLQDESGMVATLAASNSRAQQVLEVLTSPHAQRVTLTPGNTPNRPTGRAIYLADRGGLIFQANNLEPLPENKTYELWVIPANGKSSIPAGIFRPDSTGSATLVLPPLPQGVPAKAFGVTIEKQQGSDTPTVPIILSGAAASIAGE